ncbi:MAG: hypothetical protein PHO26_08810 [Dehalococcoidia bacterium]|nr:hypothetical protein [Dehalococcoidia bacterium]MDD5494272.1 hypothetical protein [Dehalococcoidia bacterium]
MPRNNIDHQSIEKDKSKNVPEVPVPGFVLGTTVAELVISKEGIRTFVMNRKGALSHTSKHRAPHFYHVPPDDTLAGSVVHFARESARYCQPHDLLQQIQAYIHKYLELPSSYEAISALYVLLSWVYEFAPSVPYLRVIGDWGTGKTRFLQVVGSVCFRPIFASGAATPSPIFRILDQYRGTLVLDEADFKESSAWVDMIKILNNGYRPGFPVLRADKVSGRWRPRGYQVFGPKLIATRFRFEDEALESRCLTAMMPVLTRSDIPRMFPASFNDEVHDLRSKLLTFRLYNLSKLKGSEFTNDLLEPGLQPRLQEILMPLKALAGSDQYLSDTLSAFIKSQQESMYSRRRDTLEGLVVSAMLQLRSNDVLLTSEAISYCANDMDEDVGLTARKVGWVVKRLGFLKRRLGHDGRHIVVWDDELAFRLASQYGISLSPSKSTEKTSPTSPLSP